MRVSSLQMTGLLWAGVLAIGLAGCNGQAQAGSMLAGLQSENPSVRIHACVQAANAADKRALPLLVERLEDTSGDVRFSAFMALKKITGQSLGYRWYDGEQARAEAVRRWRDWLRSNRPPPKPD